MKVNNRSIKIAIYSGEIPSTTFIERLILSLRDKGFVIQLFGAIKRNVLYDSTIENHGYKNHKLFKAYFLVKYTLLLFFFRRKEKQHLDKILKAKPNYTLVDKLKSYPVLWYKPTIFHVQWAKNIQDWLWVPNFGIKLVLSLRGAHINYSPLGNEKLAAMYSRSFPKVDGFHAVSKAIALEAQKYGAPPEKIQVVYSGLELIPPEEKKKQRSSCFNILSVGRSHWIKGYPTALDCCKLLKSSGFDFNYTIIGGLDSIELKYQLIDLELENEVTLLDTVPFGKVQEMIQASDLLLLPSLKEGIANVVLESMALGTPVLTTACGGMTEVIVDSVNGFVCPVRTPDLMAKRILDISHLPQELLDRITSKAKETVSKQHSIEQMLNGMTQLYEHVLNNDTLT